MDRHTIDQTASEQLLHRVRYLLKLQRAIVLHVMLCTLAALLFMTLLVFPASVAMSLWQVTRHNRVVGVMVSAEDYEGMRAFYADRLQNTMSRMAERAAAQGLTPAALAKLLLDER